MDNSATLTFKRGRKGNGFTAAAMLFKWNKNLSTVRGHSSKYAKIMCVHVWSNHLIIPMQWHSLTPKPLSRSPNIQPERNKSGMWGELRLWLGGPRGWNVIMFRLFLAVAFARCLQQDVTADMTGSQRNVPPFALLYLPTTPAPVPYLFPPPPPPSLF